MEMENQLGDQHSEIPRRGTTFFKTCGLNSLSGIGILSMPYAVSQGGWLSLVLLFLVAILCWYTGMLLHRCMDVRPLIKSYPDIGEEAFGYKGRAIVSIFMYLKLYLVATEFLILEGDNMEKLFPNMSFKVCGLRIAGKQGFLLLTALVILPTTWLRSLGVLAYVSVGGVLASVILVGCVMWVGAFDGADFHERGKILKLEGLTASVSFFTFCYFGHAVFPTLRSSMKDTRQFPKINKATQRFGFELMIIMGILLIGPFIAVVGTYKSVRQIVNHLQKPSSA
ncbi:amino acid transporter AVT1I-like isoform X2 [Prosopis cineraria]|uniref:amino acid transporter AVT1I-like isoform X2 n=1 Tax=Prosopis cineraria TaxID=364024 RepID=UPI00240FB785|nr:amino acid transporter AVT1I-like isoform X2 [Prosopis cineraria]